MWTWKWINDHLALLSTVGGAVATAAGVFWRYWLRARWRELVQLQSEIVKLPARMKIFEARMDVLAAQVMPNGGASLADSIARSEATAKRIENSLQAHRAWTMAVHDVQGVPFFSTDESGGIVYASAQMLEVVGNRTLGNEWIAAIHPTDRHRIVSEWRDAVAQQRSFREIVRFRCDEGETTGIIEARPLFVAGQFVGFVGHYKPVHPSAG